MSVDDEAFEPSQAGYGDYVLAVLARSSEEAALYRALLSDHDIPAIISTDEDVCEEDELGTNPGVGGISHGVAVLVPVSLLDEASEIIADREDMDEFDHEDDRSDDEEDDEFDFTEEVGPEKPEKEDLFDEGDGSLEEDEEDL